MNEEGLKFWEVIKLCYDGAYIKGDMFKNEYGQMLTFYDKHITILESNIIIDSDFKYYGNCYEVIK